MSFKDVGFSKFFSIGEIVTFRWNSEKFEYGRIRNIMENGVVHIIKLDEFLKDTNYFVAIPTDNYPEICKINCSHQGGLPVTPTPWCLLHKLHNESEVHNASKNSK